MTSVSIWMNPSASWMTCMDLRPFSCGGTSDIFMRATSTTLETSYNKSIKRHHIHRWCWTSSRLGTCHYIIQIASGRLSDPVVQRWSHTSKCVRTLLPNSDTLTLDIWPVHWLNHPDKEAQQNNNTRHDIMASQQGEAIITRKGLEGWLNILCCKGRTACSSS